MRVLVTGWPSFLHGEATAGDVLSMRRIGAALAEAGVETDSAWSPRFRPGALRLDDAAPDRYSHLVFACGPAHGEQVRGLHERYASCRRIAVGVSVIDPGDPAVTGFHQVLARDGAGPPRPDLAASAPTSPVPVAGIVLAPGQREYGDRRRHEQVHKALLAWAAGLDCARVPLDTRLDAADWRHCATGDQFVSLLGRLDVVLTTRLHGLVLALRAGVPALAVDPVGGGGKVSAQARALGWPAVVAAEDVTDERLDQWWRWCLSPSARQHAVTRDDSSPLVTALLAEVGA
ncbi:polysaccharide pyruvyl transferase family protein [Prauserella endophytica]|uniref:Polysaccharide pyruvyl transferase family protein n=1 Tax=Prauserella endophytica TaxID=1592324 RepID=A0ABY2S8C5_9PSEU|nr:polysaccharide pyruvyl transferase family protein [Prauserella endophytica]PXY21773.1 polysaccharide pyruvyl transferase [Prauserella coralliicola]TKG71564.1 polysaccharide pyruvyl transferase family protein [Prauserella endophytica]